MKEEKILKLHLEAAGDHANEVPPVVFVDHYASLGRLPDNSIVLPDASRIVSGKHCSIEKRGQDRFVIQDLSANGLYINDEEDPLGHGKEYVLAAGDRLTIGSYTLTVEFITKEIRAPEPLPEPTGDLHQLLGEWNAVHKKVEAPRSLEFPPSVVESPKAAVASKSLEMARIPTIVTEDPVLVFLEAAGLDPSVLRDRDLKELMELSGSLLRECIAGLLKSLQIRASLRRDSGQNKTQVVPSENNQLKYSINVDDAMERLFRQPKKGYLDSEQSIAEGFRDIQKQQVESARALQNAQALLDKLNPQLLEDSVGSGTPLFRYKTIWAEYRKTYSAVRGQNAGRALS